VYVAEWDTDGEVFFELRVGAVLENLRAPDLLVVPKDNGLPNETVSPCK
jgi:hypothetical protein